MSLIVLAVWRRAWDRNLTDEDGPYIELMAGVYTDNQPDFSWMQPYEEKTFTQYFLPYRELGVVKNASQDLLLNMDKVDENVVFKVFSTSRMQQAKIELKHTDGRLLYSEVSALSPKEVYVREIQVGQIHLQELILSVFSDTGSELLSIKTELNEYRDVDVAKAALSPDDVATCEQLYLTGLHIEQYRHATYVATDYYQEALHRDPSDVRNNNAMGLWLLRHGKISEAEPYFHKAIETQLQHNPNPYDGEPHYNLGLCLLYQNKIKQAYDAFNKSCWNAAWQDAGYFSCAQISCMRGQYDDALLEIEKSLIRNWHNHKGRALKSAILRKLEKSDEALVWIEESLKIDLFNFGCLFEKYLLSKNQADLNSMHKVMRNEIHNYETVSFDYIQAGMYPEAVQILEEGAKVCATTPMTYYYMAWALSKDGKDNHSVLSKAASHAPGYCFPNRLEAIFALEYAKTANPNDSKAFYYLGNLWYDKRQYQDAIHCWENSEGIDPAFPTVLRNLSLAYFNKLNETEKAVEYLEKAFALDNTDARILMELDHLYKRLCRSHRERLELLESHIDLVVQRDDIYLERATLYNQLGDYGKAIELIDNRIFHPWEGGEGKVSAQYQFARVELAKMAIKQEDYSKAIRLLNECLLYPPNLGEGKLNGAQENDFYYWLGCAHEGMGLQQQAANYWELAKNGNSEPVAAIFYNDQKPDKIFYQGLALLKLNKSNEAKIIFNKLISYGERHQSDNIKLDYFAVSLPDLLIWEDDLNLRNVIHCKYMMSLGYYGLGKTDKSMDLLNDVRALDMNHQGAQAFISLID